MRRGSSIFPDSTYALRQELSDSPVAERPVLCGRSKSLEATFDESEQARERPPTSRVRRAGASDASSASGTSLSPTVGARFGPLEGCAGAVVLMNTSMWRDELATGTADAVRSLLGDLALPFIELDGAEPGNAALRDELWHRSASHTYPILYDDCTGLVSSGTQLRSLSDSGELRTILQGAASSSASALAQLHGLAVRLGRLANVPPTVEEGRAEPNMDMVVSWVEQSATALLNRQRGSQR